MSDATSPIPHTPTTPEIRDTLTTPEIRERIINVAREVPQKKVDDAYTIEINKYKKWADEQRLVRPGGRYLTRENVDLNFTEVQKDRLVTVNTGRRIVSALQYYANKATKVRDAEDMKTKTINATIAMDRDERGVLSVNHFAQFILQNSATRRKRNRKHRLQPPQRPQPQPQPQQQQRITNYMAPMYGILPQDPYL